LTLTASIFAAYDDNVTEALPAVETRAPWLQKSGSYQGASAGLQYSFTRSRERVSLGGNAGAQLHYFRHPERSGTLPATQADVTFNARLTHSLALNVRQSLGYASAYTPSLAPRLDETTGHDVGLADDPNLALFDIRMLRSTTRVGLTQGFGRHASLAAAYHLRSSYVFDTEETASVFQDATSHAGSVAFGYVRPMTRYATLNLGYGLKVSDGRSRDGEPDAMHDVRAGVNYSRPLSFSRRTSLTFGSGSAIVMSDRVTGDDEGRRVRARLTGSAALVHELGRTWTARLTYTRGFRTREGLDQLYFTDAVTANIGGLVTRRLSLGATATWAESSLEEAGGGGHSGRSAVAGATYGLTRFLALYASYVYYQYRFDDQIALDERIPRRLNRQGVRVGLTTSVPLIR
jgi:hypothetical protein